MQTRILWTKSFSWFPYRHNGSYFAPLTKKNETIIYIDDTLIQADKETQMFHRLRNFNESSRKPKPKTTPDNTYFFIAAVKGLCHVITKNKIRPILNEIEAIKQMKRPDSEIDVMKLFKLFFQRLF